MTPEGLDVSFVRAHLAVGGCFAAELAPRLASEHRIRHVVDVRSEAVDDAQLLRLHGMQLLHLPTLDHAPLAPALLARGAAFVAERVARGERVYVHCQYGIGRSVLLAMCALVELGDAPLAALARIKAVRPCASPSPAQQYAFLAWVAPRTHEQPTWDMLASIAYAGITR
jgi:protein-tyrosine phosphatase